MSRSCLIRRGAIGVPAFVGVLSLASQSQAGFELLNSFESWAPQAQGYTTIDFLGFPQNTFITDQYASLGVLFTDSDPNVIQNTLSYPLDGAGIYGVCKVELTFDSPMRAFGAYYLGSMFVRAYHGNEIVYQSPFIGGIGFGGIVSDGQVFDRVLLYDVSTTDPPYYCDTVNFDNFWFSSVPSPGAAVVLIGAFGGRRRTRRG